MLADRVTAMRDKRRRATTRVNPSNSRWEGGAHGHGPVSSTPSPNWSTWGPTKRLYRIPACAQAPATGRPTASNALTVDASTKVRQSARHRLEFRHYALRMPGRDHPRREVRDEVQDSGRQPPTSGRMPVDGTDESRHGQGRSRARPAGKPNSRWRARTRAKRRRKLAWRR